MFAWRNIYISMKQEEFFEIKKTLEDAGIPIKTKISGPNRERMISGAIWGGNPSVMNTLGMDASMREEYRISVKKEDEEFALYTIRNRYRDH